jgi:hypothetical protein
MNCTYLCDYISDILLVYLVYQGFLPTEALISEVEVWGLGGKAAKDVQNKYKKREELFTDQRRKVYYPIQLVVANIS